MATAWGPFKKKPNILIIMTDQQRSEQHFPPGWARKNLPWLTHLQDTGVTFSRGMVSSTACSPSRSTVFTSTYPTINGVKKVDDTLTMHKKLYIDGKLTTLGQVLNDQAKYLVKYKGKWHLDKDFASMSNMRPLDQDIMMIEDDAMEAEWAFPGWTSPDLGTGETALGTDPAYPAQYSQQNSLGGGTVENDRRIVKGPLYSPRQRTAVDFLKNYNPNDDPPFCMVVSMANPHDIWVYPYSYKYAGYTNPVWLNSNYDRFQLPESYSGTDLKTKPQAQQAWMDLFQGGALSEDEALPYVKFYAYLQTLVDELTGELIQAMRHNKKGRPGQLERETVVVRLSDHGEMAMAQGGLRQKENNCYNETIHVPIIFSNPLLPQGQTREALVGLIDILPTLATIAGVDDPSDDGHYAIQGQSFADLILDPSGPTREQYLFCTDDCTDYSEGITSIRAIIENGWKYAVYYKAEYGKTIGNKEITYKNPNGKASGFQYEMYDYSTPKGWLEMDNLLYTTAPSLSASTYATWQRLHSALTRLMENASTTPIDWPTIGQGTDSSGDGAATVADSQVHLKR